MRYSQLLFLTSLFLGEAAEPHPPFSVDRVKARRHRSSRAIPTRACIQSQHPHPSAVEA